MARLTKLEKEAYRNCVMANVAHVEYIITQPYVCAKLTIDDHSTVPGSFFTPARNFHGFSKCNASDTWNPELGCKIAFGRAVNLAIEYMAAVILEDAQRDTNPTLTHQITSGNGLSCG